jgi:hypothetical protein
MCGNGSPAAADVLGHSDVYAINLSLTGVTTKL